MKFYYWLETNSSNECNYWDWALVRGMYDMDGKKDKSTEERIAFGICKYNDIFYDWNTIDSMVRQVLGLKRKSNG